MIWELRIKWRRNNKISQTLHEYFEYRKSYWFQTKNNMEKLNNVQSLIHNAIEKLNALGWRNNNDRLYSDHLVIEKKILIDSNQYLVDILLYISQVDTPIAIMEISKNIHNTNNENRSLLIANELNCPIVIYSNGQEFSLKTTDNSLDCIGNFSIISPLKLSIIYSNWIIKKCSPQLSSFQMEFIIKYPLAKIHKFYNAVIRQTCIILRIYTDVGNNNYSIPEFGFYYYIVNEQGDTIEQTQSENQMEKYYKYSVFLFDGSLRK